MSKKQPLSKFRIFHVKHPELDIYAGMQVFASMNEFGRLKGEFDVNARIELLMIFISNRLFIIALIPSQRTKQLPEMIGGHNTYIELYFKYVNYLCSLK